MCQLILEVFIALDIFSSLKEGFFSFVDLARINKLPENRYYHLNWMVEFLFHNNYLDFQFVSGLRKYQLKRNIQASGSLYYRNLIVRTSSQMIPSCDLMEHVAKNYPDFLQGKLNGFEILFIKDKMKLWKQYFSNEHLGYSVYNSFGAEAFIVWMPKGNFRVLEVGGGTGNACLSILQLLKKNLSFDLLDKYIFSDISPLFMRMGKDLIENNLGSLENFATKKIDFNVPFDVQGIENDSCDVVYGVNSLHVAENITKVLGNIIRALKPGGKIIISESVRQTRQHLLIQEFIFNLLDEYTGIRNTQNDSFAKGFLAYTDWLDIFKVVGLRNIRYALNVENSLAKPTYPILAAVFKGEKNG